MRFCSDCKHKYTMSQSPCTECRCFNKMENGNPAVALLEKWKTEIQGLIDFEESCCGNTTLGYQCLGVIDDKISELKGE